jgi:hypothetical protein
VECYHGYVKASNRFEIGGPLLLKMFGFGEEEHRQVYGQEHEAKFSHELIAGAASFEAVKLFEDRQRREGKPVSHAFAKEMLAGIAGGEVDKLIETKGLDYIDRDQAKRDAGERAQLSYDHHYGQQEEWHPDQPPPFDYNQYNYGRPPPGPYEGGYGGGYEQGYQQGSYQQGGYGDRY